MGTRAHSRSRYTPRMTDLNDTRTPALLIDHEQLLANIDRMTARARSLDVSLRPHLKTAKSSDIARLLMSDRNPGITVSTLKEAEYFAGHGIRDILYAVSIAPQKLAWVADLNRRGANVQIILDLPETAHAVADAGAAQNVTYDVLIEIDCDGHRAGIEPYDPELISIARTLHDSTSCNLLGVMTHAGEAYACRSPSELVLHAEQERQRCVSAAERIRAADIPCPVVSVGSTPTALCADNLNGVTELRAGVFVFFDLFQAGLGVCDEADISLSVLTTVISHKHSHRRLIIDAGGLALSKDHSTRTQPEDKGYGVALSVTGNPTGLIVAMVDQEHGIIELDDTSQFEQFPIGTRLRILPNHACMTAAAHDQYLIIDAAGNVEATWPRCNGW